MKVAVLISLAILFMFLIFTTGVQPTKAADCDCGSCHGANHHGDNWSGCSGCHDSPPPTGTHLTHYNSSPLMTLTYGNTAVTSTDDAYQFGCGNCHPLDRAYHNDGSVQVELYNANAAAGSLKAMNPSNALFTPGVNVVTYASKLASGRSLSYSDGTCDNIYCHSGYTVTSGPVGTPLRYPANPVPPGFTLNTRDGGISGYIMDETCSNLTYAPYTVGYQRVYKTTPPWGSRWTTQTLKYRGQTANFNIGTILTGSTSGATATIVADSDGGTMGLLTLSGVTGSFLRGETVNCPDGGSALVDARVELRFTGQTADFTIGNTLTGASSGATGTIAADYGDGTTGGLIVSDVTGAFAAGETMTDTDGGSALLASADDGGALDASCTQCHKFPLITDYTNVQAGVGDSHGWINLWGNLYGHANNMWNFGGVPCRTCHYGTLDRAGFSFLDSYDTEVYDPVPLRSRVMHVNGTADVAFDTVNGYRYYYLGYYDTSYSLALASYDPGTKTCSNISCHYSPDGPTPLWQQKVKWGTPFRGWEGPRQECDLCHRSGSLMETCQ